MTDPATVAEQWKHGDIVLSKRSGTVLEFVHYSQGRPVWHQLSPFGRDVEGYDVADAVLLCRWRDGKRLPVLDYDEHEVACYHMDGATWQGKCIDCGTVCAPNLDEVAAS